MKNKFTYRSTQAEMLDSPDVSSELLVRNLKELDLLNRFTGGHALSCEGVLGLMNDKSKVYHIADLGCGSGDWLRYMADKARQHGFQVKLTGVDIHPDAIAYLERRNKNYPQIEGYTGDYKEFMQHTTADIFHCSLFCHHLSDIELIELFKRMRRTAGEGFIINDLQRSPLAYYGAKASTCLLRGSALSRHDGPVSVLRGFTREELLHMLHKAGISSYTIDKRRFFRFLIVGRTGVEKSSNGMN